MAERFASVEDVTDRLRDVATPLGHGHRRRRNPADRLEKPVLSRVWPVSARPSWRRRSAITGSRLIRLQCYRGFDEAKAIYEWNYKKQLLRIQADREHERDGDGRVRHLLRAVPPDSGRCSRRSAPRSRSCCSGRSRPRRDRDRGAAARCCPTSDLDTELGTIEGKQRPMVFLTSNNRGAVGSAEAALPLPPHRLPRTRPRRTSCASRARDRRSARGADRQGRRVDPQPDLRRRPRSPRRSTGPVPCSSSVVTRSRRSVGESLHSVEVPVGHHQGAQGTGRRRPGLHPQVTHTSAPWTRSCAIASRRWSTLRSNGGAAGVVVT